MSDLAAGRRANYGRRLDQLAEFRGRRHVRIYRACPAAQHNFRPGDYVGAESYGRRFAEGHADHMAATEEEDYHVVSSLVPAEHVYEAMNPGEFFYDGPELRNCRAHHLVPAGG